ncbi:MAG: apolipoprotein N-acyltransferase [Oculatellaceae cyanobacterium bins.114]|nr:apolipoprotein N-acyltransferase [Oculatellaceae cyanobacterium bins.114]
MIAKRLNFPSKLAIAFSGGVLMGLTVAPVNAWWLAWVALVPLWVLIRLHVSDPGSQFSQWLYPLFWAFGYYGLAIAWIRDLHPLTWMGVPWLASVAIALFAWGAITLWGGALVSFWGWSFRFLLNRGKILLPHRLGSESTLSLGLPLLSVLLGTALWCLTEGLWSQSALWWASLSFTQSPHNLPILHLGQLSGPNAVTGAIVAVNGLLAEAWLYYSSSSRNRIAQGLLTITLTLLLTLHGIGAWLYTRPLVELPNSQLNIGIIQGNIPTRIKLFEEGVRRAVKAYTDGYRTLAAQGVDAVLMPEGALPYFWVGMNRSRDPLYQAILQAGIPTWIGTPGLENGKVTQSLFTIAGNGEIVSRYDKIKPVPLGEYLPFEPILGKVIRRLSPVELSMIPGSRHQHVDTPFGRAIAGICFDSAFAYIFRDQAATGGQFILTASNNDPYGAAMMAQHHAQDIMRSIESDRWAVRATNTGFSGVVDPHGNTIWISDFRTYETHIATIYRRQTQTLFVRWGDWLTPTLLAIAGLGLLKRMKDEA